jgi:SSS family solute:Na+ symporter
VITSLALGDAPASEKVEALTWAHRGLAPTPSMTWYRNYRIHAAAVLSLTVVMIIIFW